MRLSGDKTSFLAANLHTRNAARGGDDDGGGGEKCRPSPTFFPSRYKTQQVAGMAQKKTRGKTTASLWPPLISFVAPTKS